ncbi:MAG TPA: DUF4272 domain-containing protein [Planctomycetaceae bacterium]|nr:DUF4272 domain-containing protein [Planctomycetaceae bacterium]
MALEPINIFSHRIDPRGVPDVLRKLGLTVQIEGSEDDWTLIALGPRKLLRKRARLVIAHSRDYYDGPTWPMQRQGMETYIARFPNVSPLVLEVIRSLRFGLAFPEGDLNLDRPDERVAWVQAICEHLDGVFFTPSSLRDAQGRLLASATGQTDPAATLPAVPPSPDEEPPRDDPGVDEAAEPPTAARVMRRAFVLAAVANRGLIEHEQREFESPEEVREWMLSWVHELELDDELEPDEWKVLQRPVGTLDSQSAINSVWRLEGLGVLLWALGLYELPAYDELVTPSDLFKAVHLGEVAEARGLLEHAELRPAQELANYRTHALMVHWRLRDFSLRPKAMDFVAFSKNSWIGAVDLGRFQILQNDLALSGNAIADADPETIQTCQSSALERHLAINWIRGDTPVYSATATNT